ncbi:SctK family type III secretion system sorting platform protein [Bordetella sp. N]|uniref:SctK family type III secretion system sorting platform protein n=1 Tax=Bordetella sp. N TaxID=1746199 RepID=UPI00070D7CC6|nr:SctK family type III secretion system sorting platform protein [Bordetella sp. N]ALM86424.1 hypothetical protein ASB57_28935 [Bordetella sp. N]
MSTSSSYAGVFDPAWWQFNMLPSRTLHRSHWFAYAAGPAVAAIDARPEHAEVWHRHWSRHILRTLGLWERPAVREAAGAGWLVEHGSAELQLLARRAGAVLAAPRLRRCVSGTVVRALAAALGEDLYALTLLGDAAPHPGLAGAAFERPEAALEQIDTLGWGALHLALQQEDDPLRMRMALRLPADACGPAGLSVADALALAKALDVREIRS